MFDVCQYLVANVNQEMIVTGTQTELANEIGTAREVVGRKLRVLVSDNVVDVSRGQILIKDIDSLKKHL